MPALVPGLLVHRRVFTMDALLTQRAIARTTVDGGSACVMVCKDNHPQVKAGIALVFRAPRSHRPARVDGTGASKSGS